PADAAPRLTRGQIVYAWVPWALLSVLVFLWGEPGFRAVLNGGDASAPNVLAGVSKVSWPVVGLDGVVYRAAPGAPVPEGADRAADAEKAVFDFNWLSATGTGIFLAAVLSAVWLRIGPGTFARQFIETLGKMRWALATIACMLALAFVTKYSGSDA